MATIIQLKGEVASSYRSFLESYRNRTGKEPGPRERTEAFACANSRDPWKLPHWIS